MPPHRITNTEERGGAEAAPYGRSSIQHKSRLIPFVTW